MTEPLTDNECAGLFFAGLLSPALIVGGLAAVAIGIYFGMATADLTAAVIMGGGAFGAGCGLLSILSFYYWHRDMVESERHCDKMPLDVDD